MKTDHHEPLTRFTALRGGYRFFTFAKVSPDKGGAWRPILTNTLDDELLAADGWNVLGTFRVVSDMTPDALADLAELVNQPKTQQTDDEKQREAELLCDLPVARPAACLDLDFKDFEAADEAQARIERVLPGLRVSFSSGPSKPSRHMEFLWDESCWSPHLPIATFEWLKTEIMPAAGFVARRGVPDRKQRFWCLPSDVEGKRGSVDLSNFNRAPDSRGSLLRPLGGLTKNSQARKAAR